MSAASPSNLTVQVPLSIRRRPGRKTVVPPQGASPAAPTSTSLTRADPALVKALARAFRYQRMLEEGRTRSSPRWPRPRGSTGGTWGGCCS